MREFAENLVGQDSAFCHGTIQDSCKFIPRHRAVSGKVAIRIAFDHAVAGQLCYVFVSPVILRYIREELQFGCIYLLTCIGIEHG